MSEGAAHPVRRGGRFEDERGRFTTWSVATGARGRRWRWVTVGGEADLVAVHTVETDPANRFVRLESAGRRGLLTLHLEPDGSAHGHRIVGGGVEHLAMPGPMSGLALVGSGPVGAAAFLAGFGAAAEAVRKDALVVSNGLGVEVAEVIVRPVARRSVEVQVADILSRLDLDADGLPVVEGGDTWPLELD